MCDARTYLFYIKLYLYVYLRIIYSDMLRHNRICRFCYVFGLVLRDQISK